MKTTFYVCIFIGIFLSAMIGLSGCDKCPDKNDSETFEYKEGADAALMGFTGNETLTYLKNNKDTVRFIAMGIQNFYTTQTLPAGECEKDYKYANRKVIFKNETEGDIVFLLYYTSLSQVNYTVTFKQNLIGPIQSPLISEIPSIELIVQNKQYTKIKPFGHNLDSAYLYVTSQDRSVYRLPRIKLNTNIYEVIPL